MNARNARGGTLGALKAGAAYLPLDVHYPAARIGFILRDAGVNLLLSQSTLCDTLPGMDTEVLCLDRQAAEIRALPECSVGVEHSEKQLAYVIYTSGSTGQPKGTEVTHYNVTRLFEATQRHFQFGARDVWTLFHSLAFDFSVWEIWGALAYGGRLVIIPYEVSRSPRRFYRLLLSEGVTVLNETPSAFGQLVQHESSITGPVDLPLRFVIFGGEALQPRVLGPWIERHGDCQPKLVNMYGITETTVHVTSRVIAAADLGEGWKRRSVGQSRIWRLFILDELRQPVPIGVRGEIYVGGGGVARVVIGGRRA